MNTKDKLLDQYIDEIMLLPPLRYLDTHVIDDMIRKLFACLPDSKKLYKYRQIEGDAFDYAYDALENGYIYMSEAQGFNDDLDCVIPYDEKDVRREVVSICEERKIDFLKAKIRRLPPDNDGFGIKVYHQLAGCIDSNNGHIDEKGAMQILLANGYANDYAQQILKHMQEYAYSYFRDTDSYIDTYVKNVLGTNNQFRNKFNIYSMCESYDVNSMWAYYTNNGNGFCIEYDYNKIYSLDASKQIALLYLFKINYAEKRTPYSFNKCINHTLDGAGVFDVPKEELIKWHKELLIKDASWQYEKEWRLMLQNVDKNRLYIDIVSGVIINEKIMNNDNTKKLIELCKLRGWTIKIRRVNNTHTQLVYEDYVQ